MTNLNSSLNNITLESSTVKKEPLEDVFGTTLSEGFGRTPLAEDFVRTNTNSQETKNPHIFDNQIKTETKKDNDVQSEKQSEHKKQSKLHTKQEQGNKSKRTFFTIPIIILLIVIVLLIVIMIVIIKFKSKNTDLLVEQSKEHLEELIKTNTELEERNHKLSQENLKLQKKAETVEAENRHLMNELSNAKREDFDVTQQKSKTRAEMKAEKFNISNNYIEKNTTDKTLETVVEVPQEEINMTKEMNEVKKRKVETTEEDESDIEALLND